MATQTEVAEHLFLTDRQIRTLSKRPGAPISKGRGGYSLDEWRKFYIHYLKGLSAGSDEPEVGQDEGEAVIASLKRRKLELELEDKEVGIAKKRYEQQIKERLYAPIVLITEAVVGVAVSINSRMEGVLPRLKQAWPDMPVEAQAALQKELVAISNDLATVQPDLSDYVEGDPESDPGGPFGTEEENTA